MIAHYVVTIRLPKHITPMAAKRELETCISFGNPKISIQSNFPDPVRLTKSVIKNGSPACWEWTIPQETIELADKANSYRKAVDCLRSWSPQCSVCGSFGELVVDHDHETRLIRGLLCYRCNSLEAQHDGIFESYRKLTPAMIIGLTVKHPDPAIMISPDRDAP